jgi:hypothetical protein
MLLVLVRVDQVPVLVGLGQRVLQLAVFGGLGLVAERGLVQLGVGDVVKLGELLGLLLLLWLLFLLLLLLLL